MTTLLLMLIGLSFLIAYSEGGTQVGVYSVMLGCLFGALATISIAWKYNK